MKKGLLTAMALPLLMAACTAENDVLTSQQNGQYDNIAKVDVDFALDQVKGRLATKWGLEDGDQVGLAWLGEDVAIKPNGKAYQNHPLTAEGGYLKPATSIYVGEYYAYHPYDASTQQVKGIEFHLENQDLLSTYQDLAKKSIWIAPIHTNVTVDGNVDGTDKAGVNQVFNIYPRQFSNIAGLDLTYVNNAPSTGTPEIKEIKISYKDGGKVVSVNGFTYTPLSAPAASATPTDVKDDFWHGWGIYNATSVEAATRSVHNNLASLGKNDIKAYTGAISLVPSEAYYAEGSKAQFMYNTLPAAGEIDADTEVIFEITTTYGLITITKKLSEIAKTNYAELGEGSKYYAYYDGATLDEEGNPLELGEDVVCAEHSFVQRLYTTGKFETEVDFYEAIMNGMHVANDTELQKMLTYYRDYKLPTMDETTDYSEQLTGVTLYLDGTNGEFELSQASIALAQEINEIADVQIVKLEACTEHDGLPLATETTKVVVTDGGEIPALNDVFGEFTTTVYLSADEDWTWATNETVLADDGVTVLGYGKNFGNVENIINRGYLNISVDEVKELNDNNVDIENAKDATIVISGNVDTKLDLTNNGKITINENAALRASDAIIINEATSLDVFGSIMNYGELSAEHSTEGEVHNFGYIKNYEDAVTLITTNETSSAKFSSLFNASNNKIGTIELTTAEDFVSVSNSTNQGFIKYIWTGGSVYTTPSTSVKYNYLTVSSNIEFTEQEEEILYLEVAGASKRVVITTKNTAEGLAPFTTSTDRLKGFIVKSGNTVILDEGNTIYSGAAYIGGKLLLGGYFRYGGSQNSYFGTWATTNISEY